MINKQNRIMKVYGTSGYKYKSTPTIILKGEWLDNNDFHIGQQINVKCEEGRLVITKA